MASFKIKNASPDPLRPESSPSILVLRPDRLGDFILSTPAIRELLKKTGVSTRLTIVAGERNEKIARFFFPQARVWVAPKSWLRRLPLLVRLWLGRYDVTVDFHSYPFSTTSALMALLSGSPYRVGFWGRGEWKELSRNIFNRGVPSPSMNLHERDKSLLLVKALFPGVGHPKKFPFPLPPPPTDVARRVESFYAGLKLRKGDRVLGVHPTLQKTDNRWLQKNYLELIQKLVRIPRLKILIVHGRGEEKELEQFEKALEPFPNVFVLPEEGALFILEAAKRFNLFLCNDSGLAHLVALATRVFAIFGPSEPQRWGPLDTGKGKPKIFLKKDRLCDSVTPLEVYKEILKALKR